MIRPTFKAGAWALAIALCGACTVQVTEDAVFAPNEAARRAVGAPMTLDGEDTLPATVSLTHGRVPAPFGTVATTLADAAGQDRLIVACGGNAADRRRSGARYLSKRLPYGDVLLFDYPGYGDSEGTATAADMSAAVDALAASLRAQGTTDAVAWGHSLGGFVCAQLVAAAPDVFGAAVLETTAPSTQAFADAYVPWFAKPVVRLDIQEELAGFDSVEALSGFGGRVLVLGAGQDQQVPVRLARDLAAGLEAAGVAVTYREFAEAGHENIADMPGFAPLMRDWLGE